MHKKIHVKTKNKICAAVLVFVLAGSLTAGACAVPNVYAKTEAEKKRDAYKKKLKAKNSDIANIKDSQSDVKDSITAAAARMKTLLSKQEQLKSDIKDKQNEVEQANKKLEEAKEEEQNQYDAMKLRIQYLYENSTDNSIWSAILESNGLSDMLNRIEYATDLYKSDRELMTSYQNAVKKVEDWTMQLADEMDSLLALQSDPSVLTTGSTFWNSPRSLPDAIVSSRASILSALPRMVLISPLCTIKRFGCALSQLGFVLVEKRECTVAIADS